MSYSFASIAFPIHDREKELAFPQIQPADTEIGDSSWDLKSIVV